MAMSCTCARASGIAMRVAIFFMLVAGIAFIVFGCKVQNPPTDYAPAMFVVLGCLNIFSSLLGFWGSYHKKRVLLGFMVCGGFSILLQIGLVLSLLFAFTPVSEAIMDPTTDPAKYDQVASELNVARWALIGFLIVEIFTLVMAILLRFVIPEERPYNSFDAESAEARTSTLSSLQKDVEKFANKSKSMSEKAYDKIRGKMSAKYGAASTNHDQDWRSKTSFSWKT